MILSTGFLDIFEGKANLNPDSKDQEVVDLMYRPAEAVFGAVAEDLVGQGWAIFPQHNDQRRSPGKETDGKMISFSTDHNLKLELPKPKAISDWIKCNSTLNVAAVMGQGSGQAFTLDIDVKDPELAASIVALADEMFGVSPLMRVGQAPKSALFYRSCVEDPVKNMTRHFADIKEGGEITPSEHAIEVLADGKPITLFGKHHKTGRYFQWLRSSPLDTPPSETPVVTGEQLALFIETIDENLRRFHRNTNSYVEQIEYEWDETRKVTIPKIRTAAGGSPWVEDKKGKIIDGRETYLTKLVFNFASSNRGMKSGQLANLIADQFQATAEMSGKWTVGRVRNEAKNKLNHLLEKVSSGEFHFPHNTIGGPHNIDDLNNSIFTLPYTKKELTDRGLGFLPESFSRKGLKGRIVEKKDPIVLTPEDRQEAIDKIGDHLEQTLDDFFEDVFMANCGNSIGENRVHVVKAPTGAGKTSRTLSYIGNKRAEHKERAERTRLDGRRNSEGNVISPAQGLDLSYKDEAGVEQSGSMPIVFLLPTYANIEEVRIRSEVLNLDPTLNDNELKQAALNMGLVPESEINSRLGDMKRDAMNAGLKVMVYRGKIAAGCKMADKVQAAMEAGIGTSGFCKAVVQKENEEPEIVKCIHYDDCPAISQKAEIQRSDLIFTPHPFMQLSIPEELLAVRAVIADERIHHLFLHTTEFPIQTLDLPRKEVRLSKEDEFKGKSALDYAQSRIKAVNIIREAFKKNECPASVLMNYNHKPVDQNGNNLLDENGNHISINGHELVSDCIRVCSNGMRKDATLNPTLEISEVRIMCAQPTGLNIREEHQFWEIISDRMQLLRNKAFSLGRYVELEKIKNSEERQKLKKSYDLYEKTSLLARGEKDMRIQHIREHTDHGMINELIRISWRTVPNWSNIPMLLLDASAAPEIIHKIWGGADVKTHDIAGPLHMKVVGIVNKTFSNSSVIGDPKSPESHKVVTAQGLSKIRQAISAVSSWFGESRVVAGTSILLRKTINTDWAGPQNVDWCHYGAMRGLDFAKFHSAAFSIGRMELPVRTIDGLVAALTYDDLEPEEPFDKMGTGLRQGTSQPLMMPNKMQNLKMRSGEIVEIPTPMHPGKWGRLIQRQYREEELLQFCGRLRPVYREGEAPIWFALSSVIPEELVIDDLIHIDDLTTKRDYFYDAARKTDGILHPIILLETCPELFKDDAHAISSMESHGFSYRHGARTGAKSQGYTTYKIISDKADSFAFVRTGKPNKLEDLKSSLDHHNIVYNEVINVDGNEKVVSLARKRAPDKVDIALGTLEDRKIKEKEASDRANVMLLCRNAKRIDRIDSMKRQPSHPVRFTAANEGYLANQEVTFADVEAYESLKRIWEKVAYDTAKIIKPAQQKSNYEQLANHTKE